MYLLLTFGSIYTQLQDVNGCNSELKIFNGRVFHHPRGSVKPFFFHQEDDKMVLESLPVIALSSKVNISYCKKEIADLLTG